VNRLTDDFLLVNNSPVLLTRVSIGQLFSGISPALFACVSIGQLFSGPANQMSSTNEAEQNLPVPEAVVVEDSSDEDLKY
jgi:hypothetical protein